MKKLRQWILPVSTFVVIAGAAATVLWMSHAHLEGAFPRGQGPLSLPLSSEPPPPHSIVYRFLFPSEKQAIPGKLTLGRFVDGRLREGATWAFDNIGQWHGWAPSLFERETQWVAQEQPGWQISQWLAEEEGSVYDRNHLFWSIQALRLLDPESLANEIDMIEHSGRTVTIRLTEGPSGYDYNTDTLCWNPISAAEAPGAQSPDDRSPQIDALVILARGLNHAWHDLCRNGDGAGPDQREHLALMAENRIRHSLYRKDPTCSRIHPRLQHGGRQDSSKQAWRDYRGWSNR